MNPYDRPTTYDPNPPAASPPPMEPRRKRHVLRWILAGIGSLILLIVVISVAAGGGKGVPVAAPQQATSAPPASSVPATSAPATTKPATSAPAAVPATTKPATSAPAISESRQQALDSAQGYLSDGQGFSRAGLIDQLTSQYGEGFSLADATWAVNHSGADWNAQAVMSAKGYMSDGQGFSRAGLIDQLTSAYGEQFTLAQATYAANQVGL